MATTTMRCRVCGKEYQGCRAAMNDTSGVFHWQEVACSPECGAIYLQKIIASRTPRVIEPTTDVAAEIAGNTTSANVGQKRKKAITTEKEPTE